MSLLVAFLCRFAWGLAAGLLLTSPRVVPAGFFRVNLLVVLGLATFAALLAATAVPAACGAATVAAVAAWAGSIAWFGEKRRAGMLLCAVCAAALAGATVVATDPGARSVGTGPAALPATFAVPATALLSGLVTGLTVHAMLLGHWYLNAPGMRIDALERAIDVALAVWGVTVVAAVGPLLAPGGIGPGDATTWALVSLRWLTGIVALPILLVMSRRTLAIPNTQSATGILYVACLAAILGELTAQLLGAAAAGGA
jgi:hypothetical protein